MWPDRVSNPGPLTYESGVLPTVNNIMILRMDGWMDGWMTQFYVRSIVKSCQDDRRMKMKS